ncbi:MAG: DEAD/DEAH box helicase, partial [Nitrososphaeraceae archaeon]|nr:DEAD/DEAH box helicase [Nitrososphaeraceae archaeon]
MIDNILFSEKDYIVDFRKIKDSKIRFGREIVNLPLNDKLLEQLKEKNITKLYQFQEQAILKILGGKDIVITAPTAAGKTEGFCLPVLQKIYENQILTGDKEKNLFRTHATSNSEMIHKVSALFIYPTKALARDQYEKILYYSDSLDIKVKIFDGDLDESERQNLYDNPPNILITNFDMIHYHLLNKTRFANLFKNVKFLVVDEVHSYNGIFGSNIHYIIKRLERMISNTDKLQIIACSATLPNAETFCNQLFNRKMEIIQENGKKGTVNFSIIYPSLRSNSSLRIDIIKKIAKKHKTLIFSNSHLSAELLAFNSSKSGIKIGVHRSGLLPKVRKIMENSFKSGKLDVLSSTPTLELGIDIGDLDAVISNLVPINRLSQRLGRAARKGQEGFAFLTLGHDPISQYYKNHPEDYFNDFELNYIDPFNPLIQENQILSMAFDRPISLFESKNFSEIIDKLTNKKLLVLKNGKYIPDSRALSVLRDYSIRGTGIDIDIIFNEKKIGSRNLPYALEELHKDAIYFIAGKRYKVNKLCLDKKSEQNFANVELVPISYPNYTKAIVEEVPVILKVFEEKSVFGIQLKYCLLKISKKIIGYSNIEIGKEINQGKKIFFEIPEIFEYVTKGFIFKVPKPVNAIRDQIDKEIVEMSGYHATEHVIIEGSAMITGGASYDLGGISLGDSGLIVIRDGSIGGNGASKSLYDRFEQAVIRAHTIVEECPC